MADRILDYEDYVRRKLALVTRSGLDVKPRECGLFDHQRVLVEWALRRGCAAIFADTGLGKSRMQLAWADAVHLATGRDVLILAPLAVAAQTVAEGAEIDVCVTHCRESDDVRPGVNIINYDRLHKLDCSRFGGVVLDESSVIKHHNAKTFQSLTDAFRLTPYKLCATATPAPNDWTELGTHAEFLGLCTRAEMLAEYFCHDGGETQVWRLKGHARSLFWRWVASWGAMIRKPSDLGFDDGRYNLPPLQVHQHTVESCMESANAAGFLFPMEAGDLSARRDARRQSIDDRVEVAVKVVFDQWSREHGLEAGTPRSANATRSSESGVARKTSSASKGQPGKKQGSAQAVHEGLLQSKSWKVQADAGRSGSQECREAREVCAGQGVEGVAQTISQAVAGTESGETQVTATEENAWDRTERLQGHACSAEQSVRDLRVLRHEKPEDVSSGGSLPYTGADTWTALHELQSGIGQVQGRSKSADGSRRLSLSAWVIWCDLNSEQDLLEKHFKHLAFSVRGSMTPEEKEEAILGWVAGERPVMISKPSIMGWGINAQHCHNMAFVGVTDSYEAYYQAVRRCWRFGQTQPVNVHVIASESEGSVVANIRRKEAIADAMAQELSAETNAAVRSEVLGAQRATNPYNNTRAMQVPAWLQTEAA